MIEVGIVATHASALCTSNRYEYTPGLLTGLQPPRVMPDGHTIGFVIPKDTEMLIELMEK